ncbi:RNA recognition motif protein [Gregarina niphandrodes]|uniref:RNA recognition motif protein n=1 Tax=Gregarina niphandrodes TaxID=110365 RepID=A0A023B2D1_GRENI|nr:RNA recognition motif protein [Gregarina niphandrodes]EZG52598.1 RNA recognition motif protein [Gregarina niphandrodes]|eukprot:XP_011131884.1 RNA recognition motif protein [Gregarina niphandrodes]
MNDDSTIKQEENSSIQEPPKKRKRKSGWSVKDDSQASSTPAAGFSGPVVSAAPAGGVVPAMTSMVTPLPVNPMDAALSSSKLHMLTQQLGLPDEIVRQTRELDVTNLPPNIDAASLSDFLSAALIALKGNVIAGSPVLRSHFSLDGSYATIELRTMEEANNCMMLNGVSCFGSRLQISRTKAYPDVLTSLEIARRITMPSTSQVVRGMLTGVPLNVSAPCEVLGPAFNETTSRMGPIVASYPNTVVKTQPNVLVLRNLPTPDILPETRLLELLTTLGSLKFAVHFGMPSLIAMRRVLSLYITRKNQADHGKKRRKFKHDANSIKKEESQNESNTRSMNVAQASQENSKGEDSSQENTITGGKAGQELPQPESDRLMESLTNRATESLADRAMEEIMGLPSEEGICVFEYHSPVDRMALEDLVRNHQLTLAGRDPCLIRNGDKALASDELLMLLLHHVIRNSVKKHVPMQPDSLIVPTRVLYFVAIATPDEVGTTDELYRDVYEDIRIQCKLTGKVIDQLLVRPGGLSTDVSAMPQSNITSSTLVSGAVATGANSTAIGKPPALTDKALTGKAATDKAATGEEMLEGWCFVEFATVEDACRTRKELHGRLFGSRPAEVHFLDERVWLERRLTLENLQPNRCKQGSTTYNPALGAHIPQKLKEVDEYERREKDENRAAATAAANALFNPSLPPPPLPPTAEAKIDFDADVNKEEEDMEE